MRSTLFFFALALASTAAMGSAQPPTTTARAAAIDARIETRDLDRACVRIVVIGGISPYLYDNHDTRVRRLWSNTIGGFGTGFFVDANGLIATAAHVIHGANLIAVVPTGSDEAVPATVVYADPIRDIAFLRVAMTAPAVVSVPTTQRRLSVAEPLMATGFPLDVRERYPAALDGILGRENNDGDLQTSLAVNSGNSGGPVVDAQGVLVGLVSRGSNTRVGAQGFALLEPVRFVIPGLAIARATPTAPEPTEIQRKVARIVADAIGAGTDERRRYHERTPVDLVEAVGANAGSPEGMMVVAGHAWNIHISLLDHRGVRDVTQLTGPDQLAASRMRDLALRLVRSAMQSAPYLERSYSFGRTLLVQGDRSFVIREAGR